MTIEKQKEETLLAIKLSQKLTEIIRSEFEVGDILPTQKELTERFKVKRPILREGLEILEATGVIRKIQGKGAVILQQQIDYPIHSYTRFSENLKKNGRKSELHVIRKTGVPANSEVSRHLQIDEGEPVVMLESLGKMDGAPISIGHQYLPLEKMYDVMRSYDGGSLHGFIRDRYDLKLRRVLSMITAQLPCEHDCAVLNISNHIPLLLVKSVNVDEKSGEPIEYVETRFSSNSIELTFDLSGEIIN